MEWSVLVETPVIMELGTSTGHLLDHRTTGSMPEMFFSKYSVLASPAFPFPTPERDCFLSTQKTNPEAGEPPRVASGVAVTEGPGHPNSARGDEPTAAGALREALAVSGVRGKG